MGLQIYGNIDAGSLLNGKVQSANNLVSSGIKNLVAGDGLELELFLTSQSGLVNIQDYSVRIGIGDLNARPTGGTFDLGSQTGLAHNIDASTLQTKITAATSGTPANTTTQLSPFVFKTVFTANGSQTIPTIDSTGLTPNSTVSIVKLVTGTGSTKEQWLTRIFRNPIAFQDTFTNFTKTGVGNGLSGALGLGTADIYDQFSDTVTSFSTTMEMEITDTSGNVTTVFQIPVTIGGEVLGAGITASSISPSNFVTATDVNTTVDSVTTRDKQLFVSANRGNDATGTRNSTTKPYATFAGALADAVSGDTIHFFDGLFITEGTTTTSLNELNLVLEDFVSLPKIVFTGFTLRIKGTGALQTIGTTAGDAIDMTSGSGLLVLDNLRVYGLKLNGNVSARVDNSDIYETIELVGTSGGSGKFFNNCIIRTTGSDSCVNGTESPQNITFNNCILDSSSSSNNTVSFTNTTTAPSFVFFKSCLIKVNSSYNAFHKTSSNTSITLYFVGGTTGIAYFANPTDFTISGNYTCQTSVNTTPYQFNLQ